MYPVCFSSPPPPPNKNLHIERERERERERDFILSDNNSSLDQMESRSRLRRAHLNLRRGGAHDLMIL